MGKSKIATYPVYVIFWEDITAVTRDPKGAPARKPIQFITVGFLMKETKTEYYLAHNMSDIDDDYLIVPKGVVRRKKRIGTVKARVL